MFVFIPPLFMANAMKEHGQNPFIGFLVGMFLVIGIGYMVNLVPLWFLFVCIIVTAIVVLGLLRRGI
jgi:hypothetical protein